MALNESYFSDHRFEVNVICSECEIKRFDININVHIGHLLVGRKLPVDYLAMERTNRKRQKRDQSIDSIKSISDALEDGNTQKNKCS